MYKVMYETIASVNDAELAQFNTIAGCIAYRQGLKGNTRRWSYILDATGEIVLWREATKIARDEVAEVAAYSSK